MNRLDEFTATELHIEQAAAIVGSTVAALFAYAYVWAGDSRIYPRRNRRLKMLTRDHSHL
jgi:serine/threonine protein phosphatase PrpC